MFQREEEQVSSLRDIGLRKIITGSGIHVRKQLEAGMGQWQNEIKV